MVKLKDIVHRKKLSVMKKIPENKRIRHLLRVIVHKTYSSNFLSFFFIHI